MAYDRSPGPSAREGIRSRLNDAGRKLNASVTLGKKARDIANALRQSPLAEHFEIQETPRALHQTYQIAFRLLRGDDLTVAVAE